MASARRFWPFFAWLAAFYTVWLAIISLNGLWPVVLDHWPIAAAMAAGSYFAGSTPMGGGTVGFPVLVLLFDMPATLGRNFGLAVQSIGMVSASIFILTARRTLDWTLLRPALLGALIATPLGAAFIAPYASDLLVKLIFAVTWASFGVIHWLKLGDIVRPEGPRVPNPRLDRPAGLFIGLTGGVVASLTGVGIDMILYTVMVLYFRADLKVAIPTSVLLMAFTSLVGISANAVLGQIHPSLYAIDPAVFHNWLAAAPVVALGAPLGAVIVNYLPRRPTLLIVSTLCIAQFIWTLFKEGVPGWVLLGVLAALGVLCAGFLWLFRLGEANRPPRPGL
ncbi:sulfite exporter TauE/SafE family protein [Alkalicaulis satelles]|uniref:Probable membrane transporter protein n=2 Tax=Alkalicaulis satelles TaxID=2609175 RepID=A0A5M6ZL10_9PROT|nr:sulfite exporter TauE/SafE family protein [Alkalicaulis satelles]